LRTQIIDGAVRTRKDKDLGAMAVEAFLEKITSEVKTRALPVE